MSDTLATFLRENPAPPFICSEGLDWIAVPGHVRPAVATILVLAFDRDMLGDLCPAADVLGNWRHGYVRHAPELADAGDMSRHADAWWADCGPEDAGAEPATIWQT